MLAFLGGTGPEGLGLAARFALAGYEVVIGSRSEERAREAAEKVRKLVPKAKVRGDGNEGAARKGDIVFICVPFEGHKALLESLRGELKYKLVIDVAVPLAFEKGKGACAVPVPEGSAAEQAQALLPRARVIGAFHNLSAKELQDVGHPIPCDVLVCGDDEESKKQVMAMAQQMTGIRAVDAGRLSSARYVENLTVMLLSINRIYKAQAGIKIVGI
ncbi:MAG: NADPH-dependent F420 reductase [Dehalococcoidia bacterium]|nr:NADPH-dependent F420 reductase [Dehalococcoidia bacterium]